jgi:predicted DNA binding CopG/RHH family protein
MKKQRNVSKLEKLSKKQIEEMTQKAGDRGDIPLVKSQQVNMRLKNDTLEKAKELAAAQGVPYTSFLTRLLKEDIERLWGVFKKAE